jgi:hypothetical protein
VRQGSEGKSFFFVKKKQKTFVDLGHRWFHRYGPDDQTFFYFFFFKKRSADFALPMLP